MKLGKLFPFYRLKRLCLPACIGLAVLSLCVHPHSAQANPARPGTFQATQPDGSTITLRAQGDEYFHWLEDENGYTVLTDPVSKKYVYGRLNIQQKLERTTHEVGKVNPQAVGLQKKELPSKTNRQQLRQKKRRLLNVLKKNDLKAIDFSGSLLAPSKKPATSASGNIEVGVNAAAAPGALRIIKNLVLLVAFNDHYDSTNFTVRQEFGFEAADYDPMFNNQGPHALAPTGSIKDFYTYNSAGQVLIESTIHPAWIKLPENMQFYLDNDPAWMTLHALERVDNIINFAQYDNDGDSIIDSLTIVHSGYDGSSGAIGIWSHAGSLPDWFDGDGFPDAWTSNGGITVLGYYTGPALWGVQGDPKEIPRFGVYNHEIGHHVFGLPDLYDTDNSSEGIGNWGLMGAGSWGFDGSQLRPSHFCAWSKIDVGWVTPMVINAPNPMVSDPEGWGPYSLSDWDAHLANISSVSPDPNIVPLYRIDFQHDNLVIRTAATGVELAEAIEDNSSLQISEVTYTGAPEAVGVFRGGLVAGLPFEAGIILSTGNATHATGPNKNDPLLTQESPGGDTTTDFGLDGDTDLSNALQGVVIDPADPDPANPGPPATHDAAIIEFSTLDLGISMTNLYFNFVFASEEYDNFGGQLFDHFALFVDGKQIIPPPPIDPTANPPLPPVTNNPIVLANLPVTLNPVTAPVLNIEYDGVTVVATAEVQLANLLDDPTTFDPLSTHDIKIVIADVTNGNAPNPFDLDSALFIQVETFAASNPTGRQPSPVEEYILVENRQKIGWETDLPTTGLALWHMDERIGLLHDSIGAVNQFEGYPGQMAVVAGGTDPVPWPENNLHYKIALLQADSNYDLEQNMNRGDSGDLYHGAGVDVIDQTTVPNTDHYKWGIVRPTGISISDIGASGQTMCFVFRNSTVHNDNDERALPVECGQVLLNGQWTDGPGCGWQYSTNGVDCANPEPNGVVPENAAGFRIQGSSVSAFQSWLPDISDPQRFRHASTCAGFELTGEPIDPIDIWHTFTPTMTGFVTFELCSSNSNFDTTLEVFSDIADPVSGIPPIACNDDVEFTNPGCFHQSRLILFLQAGQTYLIRIAGYNGETGDYTLTAAYSDPPNYDECDSPVILTEGVPFNGTNSGSTGIDLTSGGTDDSFDVWHQYTPAQSGAVTLSLCGSGFDTTLAVFDDCNSLTELAFNDDCADDPFNNCQSCNLLDSRLVLDMTAGETYLIRVAGSNFSHGDYTLTLTSAPGNDRCENAPPVSDFNVYATSFTGSTQYATPTLIGPTTGLTSSCGGGGDTMDAWYSYRPGVSGMVKVSLCGSGFDTTLAVYDACGGTELACNDDACGLLGQQSELDMNMIAGQTYFIRVSGWGATNTGPGAVGDFILKVMGGEGDGNPPVAIEPPFEYTWTQGQSINVCLTASGGIPPYANWTATMLDTSDYNNLGSMSFIPTGVAQNFQADDGSWTYNLPFTFPFFGNNYTSVNVFSNGFMDFVSAFGTPLNNTQDLIDNVRIAPMWDELSTDPAQGNPGDDIYIDTSVNGQVTIRWQGINRTNGSPVQFAATLFSDGQVQFDYGTGNTGLTPTVGLSAGNGLDYFLIAGLDGSASLDSADTILYIPGVPVPPLPTGVSLSTLTGCLTGTPTEVGVFDGLFRVTDSNQQTAMRVISFVIDAGMAGDLSRDGQVNFVDYALFIQQWAMTNCSQANNDCNSADMNNPPDGQVNLLDLALLIGNWL